MDNQEKLLYLSGVAKEYDNYSGHRCVISRQDRLQLLRLAGRDIDSPDYVAQEIFELDAMHWQQWLKPLYIAAPETCITLYSHPALLNQTLRLSVVTEQGASLEWAVVLSELSETGDYYIANTRYSAREVMLGSLPLGYHRLTVDDGQRNVTASLIVCPERAFDVGVDGSSRQKRWGIGCQLYSLRSARNWGIGDFSDLAELISLAAASGADMVGVNPLHALCSDDKNMVSPYSPSDRRFLNPIYLDMEAVAECIDADAIRNCCEAPAFQAQLATLRQADLVNYAEVGRIKYQVLELAYSYFLQRHDDSGSERSLSFKTFLEQGGEAMRQFTDYEALHNGYARRYRTDPRFYGYLQWLARGQLDACQQRALAEGMCIGIIGDLAVGSVAEGCEVQEAPQLYVTACSIGAPPDRFSSEGQDWGMPAIDPVAMRRDHYRHYIDLLRANMSGVGALRIDHVMSLQRLWWCFPPSADTQSKGVYVYYPIDVMLPILCLESQRNQCVIVGEDLGVVSPEVRDAMHRCGIYGNDLFYFTQYLDGRFRASGELRSEALLSVTNHDVPTLFDWWSGEDLLRRYQLGVIPDQASLDELYREREQDKRSLLQWLADNQLVPANWHANDFDSPLDAALCESIHRSCARSASRLMLLQLEDLQLLQLPINIPSTNHQYPNWRRKQALTTSEIFASPPAKSLLKVVDEERKQ